MFQWKSNGNAVSAAQPLKPLVDTLRDDSLPFVHMTSDAVIHSANGRQLLLARVACRCDNCRTERSLNDSTAAKCCAKPALQPFCPRCLKIFSGEICPHCLSVATTNGAKLLAALDARFAKERGLRGALDSHALLRQRSDRVMKEFGLDAAAGALPAWAKRLSDPSAALPVGAEHSRAKKSAISDLRLEIASVDLALKTLGPYLGRPIEDKLAIKLTEGDSAAVFLVSWDFIAADSVHEGAIKAAAETLAGADQHVVTLLETIKKRNLSELVEAVVRRNRALEQCSRALGIH